MFSMGGAALAAATRFAELKLQIDAGDGAIVDALMPNYALGQQVRKDDERIETSYVAVPSPDGNGSIKGYLARPAAAGLDGSAAHPCTGSDPFKETAAQIARMK